MIKAAAKKSIKSEDESPRFLRAKQHGVIFICQYFTHKNNCQKVKVLTVVFSS